MVYVGQDSRHGVAGCLGAAPKATEKVSAKMADISRPSWERTHSQGHSYDFARILALYLLATFSSMWVSLSLSQYGSLLLPE